MQQRWTVERAAHVYFWVIFWPLFALVLLAALWSATYTQAAHERARIEADVLTEVAAAAHAYEQYVTRSVAHMDQVSLQLKQSWEQSGGTLQLDAMMRDGMFLGSEFGCVAILDRSGAIRTAIRPQTCGSALEQAPFFRQHKDNNSSALRIGPPAGPSTTTHEAIQFSRRLDGADGEFDGVVVATVRADYFTSFYMPSTLGRGGIVATAGADSALRVEQHGAAPAPTLTKLPADASLWASETGAAVTRAFPDGRARVLGWHHSPIYPLVGLVAVSCAEAMAA